MTVLPDSPKALAAFEDLRPLLDQTARLVAQCPFEDSGDRKQLAAAARVAKLICVRTSWARAARERRRSSSAGSSVWP